MESFIVNLIIAVLVAFLTVRLSLNQFRSQKWWELKADTYRQIIEALHHQKKWSEIMYEHELLQTAYKKEYLEEIAHKFFEASKFLAKVLDGGELILSRDIHNELSNYIKIKDEDRATLIEDIEAIMEYCPNSLNKITKLAKAELDPRLFSKFRKN